MFFWCSCSWCLRVFTSQRDWTGWRWKQGPSGSVHRCIWKERGKQYLQEGMRHGQVMVFHHLRENSRSSAHLCHVDMQTMKVHRSGPWKNGCQASFFAAQLLIAITNSYSVTPKTCSRSQAPRSCAVTDAFPRLIIGKAKYLLMIQLIPVDILVCPPNCPESWLTCKFSAVVVRMGMGCL